ncbi:hypothetical protein NBH19_08880 [Rhizobium sp. S95]|uniref:Uncharacterized protein n=1 Tax=Ciceribacter sichuanensis TaxID=2949647 RepID=A0AAJ1BWU7_9HYPH|nr:MULTISPECIES: hypothetical protein [unclassified Ciceribacter]MCM2396191.1 hypothetical protein [Ciceribacter sp. S95]MCO5957658.1 hypothetical protein [Ciceribacter sp. S101]
MSLARIALRIAAVEALKGRTLVGDHVLDTPNGALDIQADGRLRTEEEKPFVSVFTDLGRADGITGRSLIENGDCDIVFEIGVSSAMLHRDDETGASHMVGINIPASDGNREFFLDIVQRQICDALTDPDNSWAEIYRSLHHGILKIEFAGARTSEDSQRLAGHQMKLTVSLINDPLRGDELEQGTPFAEFLTALDASENASYLKQAAQIRGMLSGVDPDWKYIRRRHGMTAAEAETLGHAPLALTPDGDETDFTAARIEIDGLGVFEV